MMRDSDQRVCMRHIKRTTAELESYLGKLLQHSGEPLLSLLMNQKTNEKTTAILKNSLNLIKENTHTENIYALLDILTDTALQIDAIYPKYTFGFELYQKIIQACDLATSQIMQAYRLESPLLTLPPLILHRIDAKVCQPTAKRCLPTTTTTFAEFSNTSIHEHAYRYRTSSLESQLQTHLEPNTTGAQVTQLVALPGCGLMAVLASTTSSPQCFFIAEQNHMQIMPGYGAVTIIGDQFLALANNDRQTLITIEMQKNVWEKYAQITYPDKCRGAWVHCIKPLSHYLLVVVFSNGVFALLNLENKKAPWHCFTTLMFSECTLDVYGTHEVPLLLVHTDTSFIVFDINSLIARNPVPRCNTLPSCPRVCCYVPLGDGILATGHLDGMIRCWRFIIDAKTLRLKNEVSIEGLLGYDKTYVPQQLCHCENDNLAIRFYSTQHTDGIIIIMDPHDDHFIGKIMQSTIDDVRFMLAIPNGDLLVANTHQLVTWSPSKREQCVYQTEQQVEQCWLLAPEKIVFVNNEHELSILGFPHINSIIDTEKTAANDATLGIRRFFKW